MSRTHRDTLRAKENRVYEQWREARILSGQWTPFSIFMSRAGLPFWYWRGMPKFWRNDDARFWRHRAKVYLRTGQMRRFHRRVKKAYRD